MSLPRQYRVNATYLLTRRTTERRFFLRPDPQTATTLLFTLAFYASKHEVAVHAFVFMSNHVHLVVTDKTGNLPDFTRDFYSTVARVMNRFLDRKESFWSAGTGSAIELLDNHIIMNKIAYTLTNPVAAGIVPTHTRWRLKKNTNNAPLVSTLGLMKSTQKKRIKRPRNYFRSKGGTLPKATFLILEPPPGMTHEVFHRDLKTLIEEREEALATERKAECKAYLGMENALAISTDHCSLDTDEEKDIDPLFASTDLETLIEAKIRLKAFRAAYRGRLEADREGTRGVYPDGTYAMRRYRNRQTAPLEEVLRDLNTG